MHAGSLCAIGGAQGSARPAGPTFLVNRKQSSWTDARADQRNLLTYAADV